MRVVHSCYSPLVGVRHTKFSYPFRRGGLMKILNLSDSGKLNLHPVVFDALRRARHFTSRPAATMARRISSGVVPKAKAMRNNVSTLGPR